MTERLDRWERLQRRQLAVTPYVLLAVSVVIDLVTRGRPWPMLAAWSLLYGWTIFNPSVATATHVNGTVLLVALNSGLLIRRALRRETAGVATLAPPADIAPLRTAA